MKKEKFYNVFIIFIAFAVLAAPIWLRDFTPQINIPAIESVTIINEENVFLKEDIPLLPINLFNEPEFVVGDIYTGQRIEKFYLKGIPITIIDKTQRTIYMNDMRFRYIGQSEMGKYCFELVTE